MGTYRLLSILGEGGMGIVYLAGQESPLQRQVALKLIKPGLASPSAIARFEIERQALAVMEHPNIAHVYDAGTTHAGQPYFVMEYVLGRSIIDYCDEHRLTNHQRLKLLRHVALAIHHAHQKGVIHRDIKPSNVLVTEQDGVPVPKVIDFGIAKAIDWQQPDQTLFTRQDMLVGTPEYMSPEQANLDSRDIDASSDVYSLGVLLYELLAGALPFDPKELRKKPLPEILRIIREETPPPLTTRLKMLPAANEIARRRDTGLGALRRQLSGELDWITMRAMEKDRHRRYNSAAEFADDIERYLQKKPVLAGPPNALYRLSKFVSKNRWPVAAATAVFLALSVGVVVSTALYFRAEQARQEAARQRETALLRGSEAVAERIEAQKQRNSAEQAAQRATLAAATAMSREKEARWQSYVANIRAADEYIRTGELSAAQQILMHCDTPLRGWEWRYLWWRSDSSIATLYASEPVHSLGSSRDASRILLATPSHVDVWNSSTFKRVTSHEIRSLRMSRDGSMLLSLSSRAPAEFQLIDPASATRMVQLEAAAMPNPLSPVSAVVFSPDGSRVAAALEDASVRIWNTKSGDRVSALTSLKTPAIALAFSGDNAYLAAGSRDGSMRIWNIDTGMPAATIPGPPSPIMSAAFSPDGHQLVWGTIDLVQKAEIPSGRLSLHLPLTQAGRRSGALTIAFLEDNERLLMSRTNGSVEIRDARTGAQLELLVAENDGGFSTNEERVAVSGDRRAILVASRTGVIRVFARDSIDVKRVPVMPPQAAQPPPALPSERPEEASRARELTLSLRPQMLPGRFQASVDRVATTVRGRLKMWDAQSAEASPEWSEPAGAGPFCFSPDGTFFAAVSPARRVTVWNAATGAELVRFPASTSDPVFLDFSRDGKRIAAVFRNQMVRLWDIKAGSEVVSLPTAAQQLALNPEGTRVAITTEPRTNPLQIFEVRSHRLQLSAGTTDDPANIGSIPWRIRLNREMFPPDPRVLSPQLSAIGISFSPDGKLIAVGGANRIWLRDAATGSIVSKFNLGGMTPLRGFKFTPDGSRLVTLDAEGTVSFWTPTQSESLLSLHCGNEPRAFDISMDRLVCVAGDGTIRLWRARSNYYSGARELVTSLLNRYFLVSEVVHCLQTDSSLAVPLREAAIEDASLRTDNLSGLADWAGEVVTAPVPLTSECQVALRRIRAAASTPALKLSLANLLGEVQYRLGQYGDALTSLTRNPAVFPAFVSLDRVQVAFLAMTYQRLGKAVEARERLAEFRKWVPRQQHPDGILSRLLHEAESLIKDSPRK